jgi:hypothetical protein
MLSAIFASDRIVAKDMIATDINVKFVAFFPRFLN